MSFTKCDEWEQKETGGLQVLEILNTLIKVFGRIPNRHMLNDVR
jgi:hypothetical protein